MTSRAPSRNARPVVDSLARQLGVLGLLPTTDTSVNASTRGVLVRCAAYGTCALTEGTWSLTRAGQERMRAAGYRPITIATAPAPDHVAG